MPGRILIYILSVFSIIVILFFSWHFLISIYEVKYKTNFKNDILVVNNKYSIKCVGLNSLGWEIDFRDLKCSFKVNSGNELIRVEQTKNRNEFIFIPFSPGQLVIQSNSELSLNPSEYKLKILQHNIE